MNNRITDRTQKVLAVIYVEGQAAPVFHGTTDVNLISEASMRSTLRKAYPNIRKAGLAVLGVASHNLPDFMQRTSGHFLFSQTDKAVKSTVPTASNAAPGHSKRKVKKTTVKKTKARKPTRKSRK